MNHEDTKDTKDTKREEGTGLNRRDAKAAKNEERKREGMRG